MTFFKTTEDLKRYTNAAAALDLDLLEPFFQQVISREIKDIVGTTILDAALTDYTNNDYTGIYADFIKALQGAVATYGLYLAVPSLNVKINNGAIQQVTTEKYMPATRWRSRDLQISLLQQSSRYFDQLLLFLDENENNVEMASYLASNERKAWKNTFIYSPRQARERMATPVDYYMLLKIQPIVKRVARDCIQPIICTDLYNELLSYNSTRTEWGVYEPLREYIEEIVLNSAMALAVVEHRLSYDDQGVGIIYGRVQKEDEAQDSNEAALFQARNQWTSVAENAIGLLSAELKANSANYPLYANSTCATSVDFQHLDNHKRIFNGFLT